MNPAFATTRHQDSHELLAYLMTGLSEGLNKACYVADYDPMTTLFCRIVLLLSCGL